MDPIHVALPEEIALEGLDGITLDALWFRLSERLKLSLPLNANFQKQIWNLIKLRKCYEFFVISEDRPTPKSIDRRDFYFNKEISDEDMKTLMKSTYYIYSYYPVDDPKIRGSCKEFKTRKQIQTADIKETSLDEIREKYNQKLVIVAIQDLRNSLLIPRNVGREIDINNHAYCILERIGRSRYFGEATSGAFSLNDFVKDSKLLHYFRNTLLQNQLVVRQHLQAKVRGQTISGQLFHLPRYIVLIQASLTLQTEKLFSFLKEKPNHTANTEEVRKFLGIQPKALTAFIKQRQNLFKIEQKVPYRQCYPNATKEEYSFKKNNVEKRINAVTLMAPDTDITKLFRTEDDAVQEEGNGFLDNSNQLLNRSLSHQVYKKIETTGREGMSQLEIGVYFGLPKLNARSVIRRMQRQRNVTFYMKDEGRQRVSKFVTKNAASQANQNLVAEMTKLLLKADEAANQAPSPITSSSASSANAAVSQSPSSLPCEKSEPEEKRHVVQFMLPKPMELNENNVSDDLEEVEDAQMVPVFVPMEESSFIDNVEDVTVNMRFLNCIPKMKKECHGIGQALTENKISQKVLARMNLILDLLKTRTVIDCMTLLSEMRQAEMNFPEMICRKSMLTLCGKLLTDNFLKAVEVELKSDKKTVTLLFLVEPNVSFDMRCWHSIIEEQKIQHFITNNRSKETKEKEALISPMAPGAAEPQSEQFEDCPKFMKIKLFHEFLFYLIYAYPEDHKKIMINKAVEIWSKENPRILDYEEITEKITNCYSTEISWKMFVPPLNPQRDYENGWALIRDVIHRIPLILFIKFTRAVNKTKLLQDFLGHPIKCNYLLHFLPESLRVDLLKGRKHVFIIQELCKRLCWCGLLQFGPSRTKEIDQTFIYLNRKATLLDTKSSDEGYLEVSENEYPELTFEFDTPEIVGDYWNQMYHIAVNTQINKRNAAIGKTIEIEHSNTKPALQIALKVQTAKSAPLSDLGILPGDHKGAAGLDKSLMAHLHRNWARPLGGPKKRKARALSRASLGSSSVSSFRMLKPKAKTDKANVIKEAAAKIKNKILKPKSTAASKNSKIIRKKIPSHQIRKRAMETDDAVDKAALKMTKTMRVRWSDVEDRTLILTKVAMKFAFPAEAQSSHYVSQSVLRDILHWRTERAQNKTCKACSRRLQFLINTKSNVKEQIALYVEELNANTEFNLKYRNVAERLKKMYPLDEIYNVVKILIVEIVHRLHQIFYKQYLINNEDNYEEIGYELPQNFNELIKNCTVINPADSMVEKKYFEPKTPKDAEINMLMFLVHGDVCCTHDKRKQQVEVYMKYPDTQLSAAITHLKKTNVISVNKKDKNKDKSYLPSSFPQFHLSIRYGLQMMNIPVPVELYGEYLQSIEALSSSNGSHQMKQLNCGWIFMLAEMMCSDKIYLSYDRAEKLVMVDPALRKKSTFDKISDNYLKLKSHDVASGSKIVKNVKFSIDESYDDTYSFCEDPIEVFLKIRSIYQHVFCVLQALGKGEDIHVKSWKITDDGTCTLKRCIIKDDDNFDYNIQEISSRNLSIVEEILENSSANSLSLSSVTTQNFLQFFEEAIHKHSSESEFFNMRDVSTKAMPMWKKMTTRKTLEAIQTLATEPGLEEDSWLTKYKKTTRRDDEDGLEDEDMENIRHSKMFNQLKELNLNQRTSDSFVVNLSTIYINLNGELGEKSIFAGREILRNMMPFDEEERRRVIDIVTNEALYTENDLEDKEIFEELHKAGITGPLEIMQISEVCSFVQSKSQMGATATELLEVFTNEVQLQKQMEILIKLKFIFKVGVIDSKFVHKEFASIWLVESYFATRSTNDSRKRKCDNFEEGPDAKKVKLNESAGKSTSEPCMQPKKPQNIHTTIRFRPSPWIRVDGSLNREVLDKWLGTILNHLSMNPSMMLSDLCNKFNVVSPFHMRSLCEILQMLGIVQLMALTEPEIDLFSTEVKSSIELSTIFSDPEKIFVETRDDAMQRLAFFIDSCKN